LSETNWTIVLENEWMVEFYAPWCPACRNLQPTWKEFADQAVDLHVSVGAVDITVNPALSGIFFIASLPTIYHVKNGEFRLYEGNRNIHDFQKYISTQVYLSAEPLPWYISPGSAHMRLFGSLVTACLRVKDFHGYLVESVGLPSWVAYVFLGVVMLVFGVLFGLIFVVCCDYVFPPRAHLSAGSAHRRPRPGPQQPASDKDDYSESGEERSDAVITSGETPQNEGDELPSGDVRHRARQDAHVEGTTIN
jgi:thiol-disulfide isomerase/thioredoxin